MNKVLPRACVYAYDALALFAVAVVLSFAFITPAYAYVDPSVMTYAIQAVAGVAVALSTVLGVAFRRTRKKLLNALGVDENARKEHEPRVHRVDVSGNVVYTAADEAEQHGRVSRAGSHAARADRPAGYAPKWVMRLAVGMAVSFFAVFTVLVIAPCEIIAGNESSLLFGLSSTWAIFLIPGILIALALGLVLSALRGRVFNAVALLVFGVGLACYVQVMGFNGGLPTATGATVDWTQYKTIMVISTGAWVVVAVLPWLLSQLNRKMVQFASLFLSVALVLVQGVGLASLFVGNETSKSDDANYLVTETGMMNVTEKNNIVVFILDGCDTKTDVMPALEQDPSMLSEMTGFTWFQNSTPGISPTREALPALITGKVNAPHSDSANNEKAQNTDYLADLDNAGYDVGLYSDMIPGTTPDTYEHTINGLQDGGECADVIKPNAAETRTALWKCAMYRDLPWAFKPFFWFYTDEINVAMGTTDSDSGDAKTTESGYQIDTTPYITNDAGFYEKLSSTQKLSVVDNDSTGSFRLIHLNGPHYPYILDADAQLSDNSDRVTQTRASFRIVSEYIEQMKQLGVYDDATIIITADHGYRSESNFDCINNELVMSPVMLVKPAQSSTDASRPLQVSQVAVDNVDVMATALTGAPNIDATEYPDSMLSMQDTDRTRYFYFCIKDETFAEKGWMELQITGDALDANNWTPTGLVYDNSLEQWVYIDNQQEFQDKWLKYLYKNMQ